MICALSVRKLKPGTFEEFREKFMGLTDLSNPPEGMVRFNMLRSTADPDEVITFGFFDSTVDELRAMGEREDRAAQLETIAPYVESIGADAVYEIVEEFEAAPSASPR
jgi:heme-degrading monooxygenase HmoA